MKKFDCSTCCNNVTGATVFVRTVHTGLTLAVTGSLLFTPTPFKDSLVFHENIWMTVTYVLLIIFTLTMYWLTCLCNPGYAEMNTRNIYEDEGEISLESSKMLTNGVKMRICAYCNIEQPLRSHHCLECDRCVRKFDHHCPWLDACVGEQNHRFFWLFLLSQTALLIWTMFITWDSFQDQDNSTLWLRHNAIYVIDFIIVVISGFFAFCLTCIHTYLMCTGVTTWELMSRDRITYLHKLDKEEVKEYNPFHEGYFLNVARFCCAITNRHWEKLYNRKVNSFYSNLGKEKSKFKRKKKNSLDSEQREGLIARDRGDSLE